MCKRGRSYILLLSISVLYTPLYSMETYQPISELFKKALDEDDSIALSTLIPARDTTSPSCHEFCSAFTLETSFQLCTHLAKALEKRNYAFLEDIVVNKILPIAKLAVLVLKRTQKPHLLEKIIPSESLSEQEATTLINLALQTHYYDLFELALKRAPENYFEEHYLHILEQALHTQWAPLVLYLLEKKSDGNIPQLQQLLQEYLIVYTKEKLSENMVYVLLIGGAELHCTSFINIWSKLSQDPQPPQAQATLDLLSLFTHQGINEYRINSNTYLEQQIHNPSLAIADNHSSWRIASLVLSSLKYRIGYHKKLSAHSSPLDSFYKTPINKRNDAKQTMLMWAALFNHKAQAQQLLEKGAHVNARDYKKRTALFYAARYASPELVNLLIHFGACTSLKDIRDKTPLDHALERENLGNALLLLLTLKEKDINRCTEQQIPLENEDPLADTNNLNALRDVLVSSNYP
jgi:ankyrin repeat protein